MNDFTSLTDKEVLDRIGARLKELRIDQNVKQKELAERSGLSNFSISQMETGHNTSLQSLIQVLRALDRLDMLDPLLREREIDAAALARFIESQPQRKRVSRTGLSYYSERTGEEAEEDAPFLMAAEDETKYGK